jgi:hypothetical protein
MWKIDLCPRCIVVADRSLHQLLILLVCRRPLYYRGGASSRHAGSNTIVSGYSKNGRVFSPRDHSNRKALPGNIENLMPLTRSASGRSAGKAFPEGD